MRFFITIGGCAGFVLAFGSSLHAGNAPAFALRDGGIGCLIGAILFRTAHWAFTASLHSHLRERAAAKEEAVASTPEPINPVS
jgi:hypothetical protein